MANGTCGKNLVWNLDNDGTLTISGEGEMDHYNSTASRDIPWYSYRYSIRKIILNKGVTSISGAAFSHCENLKVVKIPDSVTTIEWAAFWYCHNLRDIKIPDSVTYIGESAFCGCGNSLTEIIIPDGITSIFSDTFNSCWALTKVTIPDSVTYIGYHAFVACNSLIEVTIPESVTEIANEAFSGCKNLTSVVIPDAVTTIGDNVFKYCRNLKKIYYRSGLGFESKLSMGNNAELIPVTPKIPNWKVENIKLTVGGTDKIKDYSKETPPWHDYLKTVQRIVIEDGVKEISANAFSNILRLEHVTIPASVKTIGDMAFTISHCGERTIDGGKNVLWSLERGILVIKKNPAAKADADFSTGYESWNIVEKNFKAIKIECGIIPSRRFFEWLWQSGRDVQIKFV